MSRVSSAKRPTTWSRRRRQPPDRERTSCSAPEAPGPQGPGARPRIGAIGKSTRIGTMLHLKRFIEDERGIQHAEEALLLAAIAMAAVTVARALGSSIGTSFSATNADLVAAEPGGNG